MFCNCKLWAPLVSCLVSDLFSRVLHWSCLLLLACRVSQPQPSFSVDKPSTKTQGQRREGQSETVISTLTNFPVMVRFRHCGQSGFFTSHSFQHFRHAVCPHSATQGSSESSWQIMHVSFLLDFGCSAEVIQSQYIHRKGEYRAFYTQKRGRGGNGNQNRKGLLSNPIPSFSFCSPSLFPYSLLMPLLYILRGAQRNKGQRGGRVTIIGQMLGFMHTQG